MTLRFRNLNIDPETPVENWPVEAVKTALERGSLRDWRRLHQAISNDPWGLVARHLESALDASRPYGVAELMDRSIDNARRQAAARESKEVAEQVRHWHGLSGLTAREFAERIGTSPSRFSTYRSGQVMPSAGLLLRMKRVAESSAIATTDL
jgi:hypothetical protein